MTRLVLINGAPGSGKSTIAQALAQDRSMTLAVNIDGLKHSLGRWDEDPSASGLHARRLTLALAREQVRAGFNVIIESDGWDDGARPGRTWLDIDTLVACRDAGPRLGSHCEG